MGRIFLNYRREDSKHSAGRLYDRLEERFGADNVTFDIDSIPLGVDFVDYLDAQVSQCDALLAMIGHDWLAALNRRTETGEPDFVRVEIEAALARKILVIPVLVDAARVPSEADLPENLRSLSHRNAARLNHERFRADAEGLIEALEWALSEGSRTVETSGAPEPAAPALRRVDFPVPEMVRIEPGEFMMGSDPDEPGALKFEQPKHLVRIGDAFEIGKYAVTFDEYDASCERTGRDKPSDAGWGRGRRPVINVLCEDAEAYCAWLSQQTGDQFRLPSEAEWEYCCRAGTTGAFSFEQGISPQFVNYDGNLSFKSSPKGIFREKTVEVGSLPPNPWGLHEMHGNVWEWCGDCWNAHYRGAPNNGATWLEGDSSTAVIRGGSWSEEPKYTRSAIRADGLRRDRELRFESPNELGFRVVRAMTR